MKGNFVRDDVKHYSLLCGQYVNDHGFIVENGLLTIKKICEEPLLTIGLNSEIIAELEKIKDKTFAYNADRTDMVLRLASHFGPKDKFGMPLFQW